jgi:hypothetical protein
LFFQVRTYAAPDVIVVMYIHSRYIEYMYYIYSIDDRIYYSIYVIYIYIYTLHTYSM